ncbi:hypothetical protein, partial [Desulfatiferula olefinivorans]
LFTNIVLIMSRQFFMTTDKTPNCQATDTKNDESCFCINRDSMVYHRTLDVPAKMNPCFTQKQSKGHFL